MNICLQYLEIKSTMENQKSNSLFHKFIDKNIVISSGFTSCKCLWLGKTKIITAKLLMVSCALLGCGNSLLLGLHPPLASPPNHSLHKGIFINQKADPALLLLSGRRPDTVACHVRPLMTFPCFPF